MATAPGRLRQETTVVIESTASTFLAWVRGARAEELTEEDWRERYERAHPAIFATYYRS
jgi:hypothetical protein